MRSSYAKTNLMFFFRNAARISSLSPVSLMTISTCAMVQKEINALE